MTLLDDLGRRHGTEKVRKFHGYTSLYAMLLGARRDAEDEPTAAPPDEADTPRDWLCRMLTQKDAVYSEAALGAVAAVLDAEARQRKGVEADAEDRLARAFEEAKQRRLVESFGSTVGLS